MCVLTPDGSFIEHRFDKLQSDIPMLFGFDLINSSALNTDDVDNVLVNKCLVDSMPLARKFGHMYLEWYSAIIPFTQSELKSYTSLQAS